MTHIWLPPRLTQIGKEVFPQLHSAPRGGHSDRASGNRHSGLGGCEQLRCFTPLDWGEIDQIVQAEHNAFLMCDNFEQHHG